MARNLRRALADSRATATANFYGFTPAEAKEFEKILRIQEIEKKKQEIEADYILRKQEIEKKKQEIEKQELLLYTINDHIKIYSNNITRQRAYITDLNRELYQSDTKVYKSAGKTKNSIKLINGNSRRINDLIDNEGAILAGLNEDMDNLIRRKNKIEIKIEGLNDDIKTIQKGGKKRVFKRKARSAIRRKPTVFRRRV